jgi:allantoate deiminase
MERCAKLAQITDEPGRITRGFLSPAMEQVNSLVASWMAEAGLTTELDVVGNLIGTRASGLQDAPVLVLGSHLDTVRDAGRYDGVLGVLLAVAAVERLGNTRLPFDLEVVAFADEEGLRYGVPFLGSQALIGELDPRFLERRDDSEISMRDAIQSWGGDPDTIRCRYRDRKMLGYFEAHIEQGPWLEHQGLPLGVLEALCGSCWLRLCFSGRAGHAGTTPMDLRHDALTAAAELVLGAESLARCEDGLVATVGKLSPTPGAGNVIPGMVELSLDIRHRDSRRLAASVDQLLELCQDIAQRRGLSFEHEILHGQEGVEADPQLSQILTEAVEATGTSAGHLVLGAGHDALIMSRIMPMTMLLLRSPGGISHHPDEAVLPQDVGVALLAVNSFVQRLAELEAPESWGGACDLPQRTTAASLVDAVPLDVEE